MTLAHTSMDACIQQTRYHRAAGDQWHSRSQRIELSPCESRRRCPKVQWDSQDTVPSMLHVCSSAELSKVGCKMASSSIARIELCHSVVRASDQADYWRLLMGLLKQLVHMHFPPRFWSGNVVFSPETNHKKTLSQPEPAALSGARHFCLNQQQASTITTALP